MSNKRDMEPSLDFYELRRRHEEFKNSQRQAQAQPKEAEPVEAEAAVEAAPVTETVPSYTVEPVKAAEAAQDAEDTVPAPSADFVVEDTADAPEDGDYEDEDGEDADASDEPVDIELTSRTAPDNAPGRIRVLRLDPRTGFAGPVERSYADGR